MSKYDVRYVSNQQMKALASEDPYKDDFYYHTHLRRTEEKLRGLAHKEKQNSIYIFGWFSTSPDHHFPLPNSLMMTLLFFSWSYATALGYDASVK